MILVDKVGILFLVGAVFILELTALKIGIDGKCLIAAMSTISFLGGLFIGKIKNIKQ